MSGFLRRLAAQAMGIASPVRTAASSPFSAMSGLVEESLPVATPVAASQSVQAPATVGRSSRRDDRVDLALPVSGPSPDRVGGPGHPGDLGVARPDWRAGRGSLAPAPASGGAVESGPPSLLPSQPETGTLPPASAGHGAPIGAAMAEAEAEGAPLVPDRPVVPVAIGPAELLLPPLPIPSGAGGLFERQRPGAGFGRADHRAGAIEETTEVHVSIGRIEVTAVHEPPAQKRPAPRRPAPMSLDEYVATRQGRRP